MVDGTAVWFGTAGFEVLAVVDDGVELTLEVETTSAVVGCSGCGTRAIPKDRRWVTLRDAPAGRRSVRLRWRKRIWRCAEPDCETNTWTEASELADPRRVLTSRAAEWATDRVEAIEGTPTSIARGFGVAWSTVWSAVERVGTGRVDDPARVRPASMVGFDETVMSPASRRRRRRFVTAVVDVGSGQLLDVFEGRDAKDLRAWMTAMPASWLAMIDVVSVDPHEGYRSGVIKPDPATGRPSPLAGVAIVVDPFHVVRLANDAVTRCRQRVQQDTVGHRGWKDDPLYGVRKLFLMGAERLDERGWERLEAALDAGDPDDAIRDCWVAKERVRDVYLTDDPVVAASRLDEAIAWCIEEESGPELRRLAKLLRRWRTEIVAHHTTGASNGPVEAMNLLIKQVKRSGRGFRSFKNYRLRILLAGGRRRRETQSATSIRTRRPRFVA
ncbi:MAG: ISL3 family transposase [Actinomycetota bacterium]|nr:ISL3 family transposase [Actinomycetota bacterium]